VFAFWFLALKFSMIADDGKIIFPLAWAQGVGCAIMGTIMIWKADVNRV
jgi:hypothetical protein